MKNVIDNIRLRIAGIIDADLDGDEFLIVTQINDIIPAQNIYRRERKQRNAKIRIRWNISITRLRITGIGLYIVMKKKETETTYCGYWIRTKHLLIDQTNKAENKMDSISIG